MRTTFGTPPSWKRSSTVSTSLDRKSTRLNSSHITISYAVFCLKKKTRRLPRAQLASPPAFGRSRASRLEALQQRLHDGPRESLVRLAEGVVTEEPQAESAAQAC